MDGESRHTFGLDLPMVAAKAKDAAPPTLTLKTMFSVKREMSQALAEQSPASGAAEGIGAPAESIAEPPAVTSRITGKRPAPQTASTGAAEEGIAEPPAKSRRTQTDSVAMPAEPPKRRKAQGQPAAAKRSAQQDATEPHNKRQKLETPPAKNPAVDGGTGAVHETTTDRAAGTGSTDGAPKTMMKTIRGLKSDEALQMTPRELNAAWARFNRTMESSPDERRTEKAPREIVLQMLSGLDEKKKWFDIWLAHDQSWVSAQAFEIQRQIEKSTDTRKRAWLTFAQMEDLYKSTEVALAVKGELSKSKS